MKSMTDEQALLIVMRAAEDSVFLPSYARMGELLGVSVPAIQDLVRRSLQRGLVEHDQYRKRNLRFTPKAYAGRRVTFAFDTGTQVRGYELFKIDDAIHAHLEAIGDTDDWVSKCAFEVIVRRTD
jgi:hypothetical protein